jgi:DNA-binding transcriptional regulator GbsR (MarR family)
LKSSRASHRPTDSKPRRARVTAPRRPSLARSRALGVDTCGRIAAFWGFTRTMGRIFGLLYLSPRPLPRDEIQRRLAISVGSASMTLTALQRWGVVHKVRVRGVRADHYAAETDFWKMISRVLDERERKEITTAVRMVQEAKTGAVAVGKLARGPQQDDATFVTERLDRLHDICALGQTLLDMLLGQLKLDVGRFRDVLRVTPHQISGDEPGIPEKSPR